MKIAFVIANGYTMGGTVRTVYNLAEGLSRNHEVEIVSLARKREDTFFRLPEGVRIVPLSDSRPGAPAPEHKPGDLARYWWSLRAEQIVPHAERARNRNYTPEAVAALHRYLRTTDADVVMGTRPGINLLIASWAPKRVRTIGQEHLNLNEHTPEVAQAISRLYPRLNGVSVLTDTDRKAYAERTHVPQHRLVVMPNPLDAEQRPRSALSEPVIAAAGRLSPVKQYPKLLQAFTHVAEKHPEWRLRIYGSGDQEKKIRETIERLGLADHVELMGQTKDVLGPLSQASVLAISSRVEGFGMTIVEGFSVGVPVVSFDCPHGPREIIEHGHDGLLVPSQDVDALGKAMLSLVEDPAERERMGDNALASAQRYGLDDITRRWEGFLRTLR
ncbi:glycosyltransferase family 4 protein [Nocardiopsis salina]|uniref:glycosyltransferase family 4 protein n=1 Tax=Nocardiopsis salina TaxID=245836 RepID=UPI000346974C|nr:glycosyltransferase family 4 protein [Nocardiopsis salina]